MNTKTKERIHCRLALPVTIAAALTVAALSTGSAMFLTAALLVWLLLGTGFLGVWWAARTLTVTALLSSQTVQRGEDVALEVAVKYHGLIPIAPLTVDVAAGPDRPAQQVTLSGMPGSKQRLSLTFHAAHVGVTSPGVERVIISDLLGMFTAEKRLRLACEACADLPNVLVHPTGPYMVSSATFPTYFLKDKHHAADVHCELDVQLFGEKIAPALGITRRYVGTEPLCPVTAAYNARMKALLPEYGVQVIEIERKSDALGPISASRVRTLLEQGDTAELAALLPSAVLRDILR